MKIIVAHLRDDVSCHQSIGAGLAEDEATEDAVAHFYERPRKVIEQRIKDGRAAVTFHVREVRRDRTIA